MVLWLLYCSFAGEVERHRSGEGHVGEGVARGIEVDPEVAAPGHEAVVALVLTFSISLVGLFLGKQIMKLLKGKYEISGIIGGCILILLAVWVVVSHYTGI